MQTFIQGAEQKVFNQERSHPLMEYLVAHTVQETPAIVHDQGFILCNQFVAYFQHRVSKAF